MNDDLGDRIGRLIDAEGEAFARGHAADDLLLYRKAIRPRRAVRRAARAGAVVCAVGVLGLGAWTVADRAIETPPASSTSTQSSEEWPASFLPYVHGFEFRGTDAPAEPASGVDVGSVPGCASLASYGDLARASDAWTGVDDAVVALGAFWQDGESVATVAVRSFDSEPAATTFAEDFAGLVEACEVPWLDAGGGRVVSVGEGADGYVVGVATTADSAVGVLGPAGSEALVRATLDSFAAQAPRTDA